MEGLVLLGLALVGLPIAVFGLIANLKGWTKRIGFTHKTNIDSSFFKTKL